MILFSKTIKNNFCKNDHAFIYPLFVYSVKNKIKQNHILNNVKFRPNPMTYNTKKALGLLIAITMVLGGLTPALPSAEAGIKQQFNTGMPVENLSCSNPDHQLAIRENGKPICAKERTLERLGLEPVSESVSGDTKLINDTTKQPLEITYDTISNKNQTHQVNEGGFSNYWPKYTITFPEQARVGEPFDIVYDYTYAIPDNDGSYEEYEERCEADYCGDDYLSVFANSYVTLHDVQLDDYKAWTDHNHLPFRSFYEGTVNNIYDTSGPQQKTFTFTINEPDSDYRYGKILIETHSVIDDYISFHVENSGNITLTQKKMDNVINPIYNSEEGSVTYFFATTADYIDGKYLRDDVLSEFGRERNALYDREFLDHELDPEELAARQQVTERQITTIVDLQDEQFLDGLVEFLLVYYPDENYREMLRHPDWNITEDAIEYLLEIRPELEAQTIPDFEFLPKAYGQTHSLSYVSGKLVNLDENNRKHVVADAKICATDYGITNGNPKYTILKYGLNDVCTQTSDDGFFKLYVPTNDPNGSHYVDLTIIAYTDNRYVEIFSERGTSPKLHQVQSQRYNDHHLNILRIGEFNLKNPYFGNYDPSQKAFLAFDNFTKISKWYKQNVQYSPPKLTAYWVDLGCTTPGLNPVDKSITLAHTRNYDDDQSRQRICHDVVISPLTNVDTLSHEFAHFAFYNVYDSKNSDYPEFATTSFKHNPVHNSGPGNAWVEGWAFFMAMAYDNSPIYQPSYMRGQWNFEDRTHNERHDSKIKGKSFVNGINGEGNVAAALWDAIDRTNERGDDRTIPIKKIWDAMADDKERGESVIAANILEWKADYDDNGNPSLDDIFRLNTLPVGQQTLNTPTALSGSVIISDNFDNMDNWVVSGEDDEVWESKRLRGNTHPISNDRYQITAQSEDCDDRCWMHLDDPINLTRYTSASLSFLVNIDRGADDEEGVYLEFSRNNGRTWTSIESWTEDSGHDDEVWRSITYDLNDYLNTSNFNVRFTGVSSASSEDMQIDNFEIRGVERPTSRGGGGSSSPTPSPAPPVETNPPTPSPPADTTPPVISVNNFVNNQVVHSSSITLSGSITDPDSEITSSQIKIDGTSWQSITPSFSKTFTGLTDTHTITIKAANSANLETQKSITLYYQPVGKTTTPIDASSPPQGTAPNHTTPDGSTAPSDTTDRGELALSDAGVASQHTKPIIPVIPQEDMILYTTNGTRLSESSTISYFVPNNTEEVNLTFIPIADDGYAYVASPQYHFGKNALHFSDALPPIPQGDYDMVVSMFYNNTWHSDHALVNYNTTQRYTVINDTFDGLGDWQLDQINLYPHAIKNYKLELDSSTGNPAPSVRIHGDGVVVFSGIARTIDVPSSGNIESATLQVDVKASSLYYISYYHLLPNAVLRIYDADGRLLHSEYLIEFKLSPTDWKTLSIDVTEHLQHREQVKIFLGLEDGWAMDCHLVQVKAQFPQDLQVKQQLAI